MKQIMKYIYFTIIVFFLVIFVDAKVVQAATCVYEPKTGDAPYLKAVFNVQNDKKLVLDTEKSSTSINYGRKWLQVSEFSLENGECPDIYIYYAWTITDGVYKFYDNMEVCNEERIGDCAEDKTFLTSGTLTTEEGEVVECSESKIKEFEKKQQELYKTYITNEFENRKTKIEQLDFSNSSNDEKNMEIYEQTVNGFISDKDTYVSELAKLSNQYNCIEINQKAIDFIEKINGELNTKRAELTATLNAVTDPVIEEREKNGDKAGAEALRTLRGNTNKEITEKITESIKTSNSLKMEIPDELTPIISDEEQECEILLEEIMEPIDIVFNWLKIMAPILLIVFGSLDFGKAIIANDNDAIKKATSNFIKRAIATVAIFFAPLIINVVLSLPGIGIRNAVCGIGKVMIL